MLPRRVARRRGRRRIWGCGAFLARRGCCSLLVRLRL